MTHSGATDRQRYAELVPEVTQALAQPHVSVPGTRLRLLPEDVAKYPAQEAFCFDFQSGQRVPVAIVDSVADNAEPRFPAMMAGLRSDPQAGQVIDKTVELLQGNKNAWVITPHGDILDIAFVTKAVYNLITDRQHEPRRVIALLSKMLTRVGFELIPGAAPIDTVATMGMMCDDVLLPWPKTESAKDHLKKLPKTEVDRNNEQVTEVIDSKFEQGDVLAAMAPTGTTRMRRDRNNALIIPTPSRGTLDLFMKPNAYVLAVPAWFKGKDISIAMPSQPVEISEEATAHNLLRDMAETLTEIVPDENFVYHPPRLARGKAALKHLAHHEKDS